MAAAALVIGAGISAYSAYKSGEEKQQAYAFEAQAKQAQAAQVEIAANRELDLTKQRYIRTQGAQIASYAHGGVEVGTGSSLMQLEDTAGNYMDQVRSIQQAAKYRDTSLLTEASFSNVQGDEAYQAGMIGAGSSILTGIAKNPYVYDSKSSNRYGSGSEFYVGPTANTKDYSNYA